MFHPCFFELVSMSLFVALHKNTPSHQSHHKTHNKTNRPTKQKAYNKTHKGTEKGHALSYVTNSCGSCCWPTLLNSPRRSLILRVRSLGSIISSVLASSIRWRRSHKKHLLLTPPACKWCINVLKCLYIYLFDE